MKKTPDHTGSGVFLLGGLGQKGCVKAVRQQLPQRQRQFLSPAVQAQDLQVRGEFLEHLAAHAAGDAVVRAGPCHGDAHEVGVPR